MVKSTPPREIWRSSNGIPNCACMLAYPACKHNSEFRRFAAEFRRYLPRNSVELAEFRRYLLRRSSLNAAKKRVSTVPSCYARCTCIIYSASRSLAGADGSDGDDRGRSFRRHRMRTSDAHGSAGCRARADERHNNRS